MGLIIGREKEKEELRRLYEKNEPVFLALYGRRRIGKTYLINNFFGNNLFFKHTGVSSEEIKKMPEEEQLATELGFFSASLKQYGASFDYVLATWKDAFRELEKLIRSSEEKRKVIFIDEMPWLDTKNSLFLASFEYFWNNFASTRDDVFLIVCGSATTWIFNKIVYNKDGLYRRVSYEINMKPMNLRECEDLLRANNIDWQRYQIAQAYMILGGTPLYLKYLDEDRSLEQNVDNLFFVKNGKLVDEFDELFSSTFDNASAVEKIVRLLATSKTGFTQKEICDSLKRKSGGDLTKTLNALVDSDFVLKYKSFKTKSRDWTYKLVDPFCVFYLKYVENHQRIDEYFWSKNFASQSVKSWQGNAFETICFNHIPQIKAKLGISGISSIESLWNFKGSEDAKGAQIDLIIERKDNVINLCEAKFYGVEYVLEGEDYEKLENREYAFAQLLSKRTIINHALITTFGLKKNRYSDAYKNVILLDDLFAF